LQRRSKFRKGVAKFAAALQSSSGIDIFCNVVANFAMPLRSFAAALQSSLRP